MRKLAFNFVAWLFASLLGANRAIAGTIEVVVGRIGYGLMSVIDGKRLYVFSQLSANEFEDELTDVEVQGLELKLLASASQVRDHAKEMNNWTDNHTNALNSIGEALIVEAGWNEENVHNYLKKLVESIDGLEYGTEEW